MLRSISWTLLCVANTVCILRMRRVLLSDHCQEMLVQSRTVEFVGFHWMLFINTLEVISSER